jgi:hypothetical protein
VPPSQIEHSNKNQDRSQLMRRNLRRKGGEGKEEVALPERIAPEVEVEMDAMPSPPSRTTRPTSPSRTTCPASSSRTSRATPRRCPGRRSRRLPQPSPPPPRLATRLRCSRGLVFFLGGLRERMGPNGWNIYRGRPN